MPYKNKCSNLGFARATLMQYHCLASEHLCEAAYYYSHCTDEEFQSSHNLGVLGLGLKFSCLQTPDPLHNTRRESGRRNIIDKRQEVGMGVAFGSINSLLWF